MTTPRPKTPITIVECGKRTYLYEYDGSYFGEVDTSSPYAGLIVTAVNKYDDLMAALRAVEWMGLHVDFPEGRTHDVCPSCIGFNPTHEEGCEWSVDQPHGHFDDCQLAAALAKEPTDD